MKRIRPPFPAKIRWQLVVVTLIATGITTFIGSILLFFSFADIILHYEEQSLSAQSQLIATQLGNEGYLVGPGERLGTMIAKQAESSGLRLVVLDQDGGVLADSDGVLRPGARPPFDRDIRPLLAGGGHGHIARGWTPFHGYDAYSAAPIKVDGQRVGDVMLIQTWLRPGWNFDFVPSILYGRFITMAISAALVLVLVTGLIARPLEKVDRVARRLAAGDLSARVESDSRGEVGDLARLIDSMADSLQKMLDDQHRLDRVRRELLADSSHEIRSPLARMQVAVQALLDDVVEDPDERREYIENVKEDILHLSRLTSDLFDLSKLELGQMELAVEPLSPRDTLERAAARFRPLAEAQGLTVTVSAPASLSCALGDRDRVGQVLDNLIGNALRYTPAGGTIRLAAEARGDWAQLSVGDTGPGIPPEALPHVFDRFYRVDKSRSRESGGTGLGLTIVREIVRAHGGTIAVESSPDQGARFTFTLPLVPRSDV